MSKKYHLVTTALEETWPENGKVIFLGEWCRLYSRKKYWENLDSVTLTYHWDDRSRLYADYLYANQLYEKILPILSRHLNITHSENRSMRYWRILIGPWLAYFIHILMDRWLSIENALENYSISETIIINGIEDSQIPNDMAEFCDYYQEDIWNHFIYSEIIKYKKISFKTKEILREVGKVNLKRKTLREIIEESYWKISKRFMSQRDVFVKNSYLGRINEAKLHLKLGQLPQFWNEISAIKTNNQKEKRIWRLSIENANLFEDFLIGMISRQIPKAFLEGYHLLKQQVQNSPWPTSPRTIFTSNILWHDTVSMAYVASKVDEGSRLVYGQHGGVYGIAKFSFAEEHEIKISDKYLTWGWCKLKTDKCIPVGINKPIKKCDDTWLSKDQLLLITLDLPRYSYRLCSESAINYKNYLNRNVNFVKSLSNKLQEKILVRLTPREMGWSLSSRWIAHFPNIKIDQGRTKIYQLMMRSRIVVLTYNQTGFLEALAMRIPTVLFCDLNTTPLNGGAIPYYDELKRVGIMHDSPESAANHVNLVWDRVDDWWLDGDIQSVVHKFSLNYCRKSDDILDRIKNLL